jgi:hypothetical protein
MLACFLARSTKREWVRKERVGAKRKIMGRSEKHFSGRGREHRFVGRFPGFAHSSF